MIDDLDIIIGNLKKHCGELKALIKKTEWDEGH